ncbi:MAG: ABC transporter permease [Neomegalonema sp.]|nr:ABC transporter permease [Neomegalonema sp.]
MGGRFVILGLALQSLSARRAVVLMTALSIAVSVALLLTVEKMRSSARASFDATIKGTDLIVGARAGDVQLLLYTVFRIGSPTRNITWASYKEIAGHRSVKWIAPLSLGDSHKGFRVLGTTDAYFKHFRYRGDRALTLASGAAPADLFDTVVGADVAAKLNYKVGDKIIVSHGIGSMGRKDELHDDLPFRIVAILAKTGTPVDRTVHVTLEAIEAIHVDWRTGARKLGAATPEATIRAMDLTPRAITAALVGLKSPISILGYRRYVNDYPKEALSAVMPGVALSELWRIVGVAETALSAISFLVVIAAAIGVGVMLSASLAARRREMAILRSVGARPRTILGLLMVEAAGVTLLGVLVGAGLHVAGLSMLAGWLDANYGVYIESVALSSREFGALGIATALGALAGVPAAWRAYRLSLADGVAMRE